MGQTNRWHLDLDPDDVVEKALKCAVKKTRTEWIDEEKFDHNHH